MFKKKIRTWLRQNLGGRRKNNSILKSLLKLSVPIVLANILHTAYQTTDTFWVGRLGPEAVAAVTMSFPVFFLLLALGDGLPIAGTVLVAQYKGKKDTKKINYVAAQTFLMTFIVSAILTIIGYFLAPKALGLINMSPEVMVLAISYLKTILLGTVFLFAFFVFQSLMRGIGKPIIPMLIVLGTVIINLFLDPILINGWGSIPAYGVTGAAIATVFTEGLAAIIGLVILFNGKYGITLRRQDFKPDFKFIKKLFKLGFPVSIEQSTRGFGMIIMAYLVAGFGTITTAAYGIGGRVWALAIIPAFGFSMATSTLVGQKIGAKRIKEAEKVSKIGTITIFWILTLGGGLVFLIAPHLAKIFVPNDPEVIASAVSFIRIMAFSFGFMGIHITLSGTLRGAGSTVPPMILSIISLWLFRIPVAHFLSQFTSLGEKGIWISIPIASIFGALITYLWYRKGYWKNKRLTEETKLEKETTEETMIEQGRT
jgi:putative MATE family efflux protein